jgi:AAA domain, putative AbiEii toxin, Type IV TA system
MNDKKVRVRRRTHTLKAVNFGPIKRGELEFGDLTVLVGAQATGKSLFLQLLKLLVDMRHIKHEFRRAGIDWEDRFEVFLDVYFGEGMRSLYGPETHVYFEGAEENLKSLVASIKPGKGEGMFFIPAQRVLTLREGWPQAFTHYDPGVPFTVREFSEELRLLMTDLVPSEILFPVPRRLKQEFRDLVQQHIFPGFDLKIDTQRAQKRLVLSSGETDLPFMVWSAGQREFVPLLLGLYYLLTPAGAPRRRGVNWVVIEELEMGLHPRAISIVMLMVFELVARGYRVCLSTHSPQVLDALWALKNLRENQAAPSALLKVFNVPETPGTLYIAEGVMKRLAKVYYFDREAGTTRDISQLDPDQEENGESGWGGLSEFSGRANDAVAHAVANAGREGRR